MSSEAENSEGIQTEQQDMSSGSAGIMAAARTAEMTTFSTSGLFANIQKIEMDIDGMRDVPEVKGETAEERAEFAATTLDAWTHADAVLQSFLDKLGAKKASNIAYMLSVIAEQHALFGDVSTNPQARWASEEEMCTKLGGASGYQYLKAWRKVSKIETVNKETKTVTAKEGVPVAVNTEHKAKGLTVYQRIFCRTQLGGVREFDKAERTLSESDLMLLLRSIEYGAIARDNEGKEYSLPSVGISRGSEIAMLVARIKELNDRNAQLAKLAEQEAETPEEKEKRVQAEALAAKQAEAVKLEAERKAAAAREEAKRLAEQQAEAQKAAELNGKVAEVLAKGKIESQEDLGLLRMSLTQRMGAAAEAYRVYYNAKVELARVAMAIPREVLTGETMAGVRTRAAEVKNAYMLDIWKVIDDANKKAAERRPV